MILMLSLGFISPHIDLYIKLLIPLSFPDWMRNKFFEMCALRERFTYGYSEPVTRWETIQFDWLYRNRNQQKLVLKYKEWFLYYTLNKVDPSRAKKFYISNVQIIFWDFINCLRFIIRAFQMAFCQFYKTNPIIPVKLLPN